MIKKIRKFINSCPEWLAWGVFHAVVGVPFVIGVSIVAAHIFAFLWNYLLVWLLPFVPVIDAHRAFTICVILALIIWWKSNDY
jgi:hypothetical protein